MESKNIGVVEYPVCNLKEKKNIICGFTTLTDCRSVIISGATFLGNTRRIKKNPTNEDLENIKLREGVKELIDTAKSKGLNLSLVSELPLSYLSRLFECNKEMREFDILNKFTFFVMTDEFEWYKDKPGENLFLKSLNFNGFSKERTLALASSLNDVKCAQRAGLQVVGIYAEENAPDSDYISRLVDLYYLNIPKFTNKLK